MTIGQPNNTVTTAPQRETPELYAQVEMLKYAGVGPEVGGTTACKILELVELLLLESKKHTIPFYDNPASTQMVNAYLSAMRYYGVAEKKALPHKDDDRLYAVYTRAYDTYKFDAERNVIPSGDRELRAHWIYHVLCAARLHNVI